MNIQVENLSKMQMCICMSNYVGLVHIWRTLSRVCMLYKWSCFCVVYCIVLYRMEASQVARVARNPPANAGDTGNTGSIPGSEESGGGNGSLEEVMGSPLQYLCLGRIPWTKEPGRLWSMGSQLL